MAIVLWSNFNHGPTSDGDYTNGATEEPVGYLYVGTTRVVAPGGAWGTINTLDTGEFWHSGVANTGQTVFNSEEGSILLLVDTYADSNNRPIISLHNDTIGSGRIRARRESTNADIGIAYQWNNFDSGAIVTLTSVPTSAPVWVQIIYDYNATPALQARWWALGGSPGSFITANASGAGVPAAFTNLASADFYSDSAYYYLGHIIVSDSAADDLTAYVADIEAGTDEYPVGGAPALTSGTPSGTLGTQTTATVGCTTDVTSGTLYAIVDTADLSAVTAANVIAGVLSDGTTAAMQAGNAAVATTTPSVAITGLTAGTAYNYALVQTASTEESNVLLGTFTTLSVLPAVTIAELLHPGTGVAVANNDSVIAVVYDAVGGTELVQLSGQAITSGSITLESLSLGNVTDTVFVLLYWSEGADILTCGVNRTVFDANAE